MEYRIKHRPQFGKTIKKLQKKNPKLVKEILDQADLIQTNPNKYEHLSGSLKGFKSAHFHRKPEYRIMFRVYHCKKINAKTKIPYCELQEITQDDDPKECNGLIDFIFVDTREKFNRLYSLPKKLLNKYIY